MAGATDAMLPLFSELTRGNDLVIVEIGPEHTTYHIHKAILMHGSEYFRKALGRDWKEGEEGKVVIDDIEPVAFDIFVDWLYTQKLPQRLSEDAPPETDYDEYCSAQALLNVKAYVVADRLGACDLRKAINNRHVDDHLRDPHGPPWYQAVIYAFNNIPSKRPILRMLVDSHCAFSLQDHDELLNEKELERQLPYDFLIRVMKRNRQIREDKSWNEDLDTCSYHEHSSDDEREQCKKRAEAA